MSYTCKVSIALRAAIIFFCILYDHSCFCWPLIQIQTNKELNFRMDQSQIFCSVNLNKCSEILYLKSNFHVYRMLPIFSNFVCQLENFLVDMNITIHTNNIFSVFEHFVQTYRTKNMAPAKRNLTSNIEYGQQNI